jgi:hypothetical protein
VAEQRRRRTPWRRVPSPSPTRRGRVCLDDVNPRNSFPQHTSLYISTSSYRFRLPTPPPSRKKTARARRRGS